MVIKDEHKDRKSHYLRSVFGDKILNAKNIQLVAIYCQIVEVYGDGTKN